MFSATSIFNREPGLCEGKPKRDSKYEKTVVFAHDACRHWRLPAMELKDFRCRAVTRSTSRLKCSPFLQCSLPAAIRSAARIHQ